MAPSSPGGLRPTCSPAREFPRTSQLASWGPSGFVVPAFSLSCVTVPTLKGCCHNPPFPRGEAGALSWLRSHGRKSSPNPSKLPGQAASRGHRLWTEHSALPTQLGPGPSAVSSPGLRSGAKLPALAAQMPRKSQQPSVLFPLPLFGPQGSGLFKNFLNRDLHRPAALAGCTRCSLPTKMRKSGMRRTSLPYTFFP